MNCLKATLFGPNLEWVNWPVFLVTAVVALLILTAIVHNKNARTQRGIET